MGFNCVVVGAALAALALATHPSGVFAQTANPAPRGKFSANFIGQGGSYQHPSGGAGDYLETSTRQEGGEGTFGPVRKKPVPESSPMTPATELATLPSKVADPLAQAGPSSRAEPLASIEASAEKSAGASPRGAPGVGTSEVSQRREDQSRYSLWEGLAEPLDLPAAKVSDAGADEARDLGRQDYDTHILGRPKRGEAPSSAVPEMTALGVSGDADAGLVAKNPLEKGEIFVSIDLSVKARPDEYRDALSGLGSAANFRLDTRFETRFDEAGPGRATISGWMPADRIGAALSVPSVVRLLIENTPSRSASGPTTMTEILVGVRLPGAGGKSAPGTSAQETAHRVVEELAASSRFVLKKTIGTQSIPGSPDTALILAGEVPIKNLSRVIAHPSVIKILPSPDAGKLQAPALEASASLFRFFQYAMTRSPILVGVTLLMAVSSLGWGILRLMRVLLR